MITLKGKTLGGKTCLFKNIISLEFESSLSVPCDSLKAKLPLEYEGEEFKELSGFNGGVCFFEGYVDCQKTEKSKDGMFLIFEARSKTSALLDNEALPYTYCGITSAELFNKFAKPYGVLRSELDRNARLSELQVNKGSSYWGVIESFCVGALKRRPHITRDMVLTVNPLRETEHIISAKSYGSVIKSAVTYRRDKQISRLNSKTGKTADGNFYGVVLTNPIAREKQISRERYYHPGNLPREIILSESERIIHNSNKDGFIIELRLPEIRDMQVGDRVKFIDGLSFGGMYIEEMKFHVGADGVFTDLICHDKRFI